MRESSVGRAQLAPWRAGFILDVPEQITARQVRRALAGTELLEKFVIGLVREHTDRVERVDELCGVQFVSEEVVAEHDGGAVGVQIEASEERGLIEGVEVLQHV